MAAPGARHAARQLLPRSTLGARPIRFLNARQELGSRRAFCISPAARIFKHPPTNAPNARDQANGSTARVSAPRHSDRPRSRLAAVIAGVGILSLTLSLSSTPRTAFDAQYAAPAPMAHSAVSEAAPRPIQTSSDGRDPSLPRYRIAEIRKHGANSENPWVIHGDKVYDITDWIPAHPGGQVILRAAGGAIDPYWNIFTIHKSRYVYDILAQYLIGYVDAADLVDGKPVQDQIEDPFCNDPERHPALITKTAKPRNAETPADALASQFLTPNELFYVRNHMWVPVVDESKSGNHLLTIELIDGTVKEYTLNDLKTKFPRRKITAVLQCSGNRRKHMSEQSGRATNGLQWASGAISNATWEGVLLTDILADAGFNLVEAMNGQGEARHVQFSGLEAYGASIPIRKAIDPQGDVLLAYSMNDKPLPRDHGFPLRAIVPGHVAARSVKWLSQITLSEDESTSQWQKRDYKCFGPNETKVDWDAAPAIQELPIQSAITSVKLGSWVSAPGQWNHIQHNADCNPSSNSEQPLEMPITLAGYAFSGGGRSIIRVDVSLDGGNSWQQARLLPDCVAKPGSQSPCHGHGFWSWKRWRLQATVPAQDFREESKDGLGDKGQKRCTTVLVKATDDAYNNQPESHAATWNVRGNLANAWHRIQVCTECSDIARPWH